MSRPTVVQVTAALSYALTSIFILMMNKIILTSYHFNFTSLMTLFHMIITWALLTTMKYAKFINFTPFEWKLAVKTLPISLLFVLNVWLGMCALRLTNIPMFTTLRRLTVLMVTLLEWYRLGARPSGPVFSSVLIMVLGSFIGSNGDLQFDAQGYALVLLNNLCTAAYLVLVKEYLLESKLKKDSYGMMYYNAVLSVPLLLFLAFVNGELSSVWLFPHWGTGTFEFYFLLSALCAFLMNYSTYWCTEVNSALTTSVTGQVKNVLSSFVSLIGFGVRATPQLVAGLCVGLSGSMLYSYAKWKVNIPKPKTSETEGEPDSEHEHQHRDLERDSRIKHHTHSHHHHNNHLEHEPVVGEPSHPHHSHHHVDLDMSPASQQIDYPDTDTDLSSSSSSHPLGPSLVHTHTVHISGSHPPGHVHGHAPSSMLHGQLSGGNSSNHSHATSNSSTASPSIAQARPTRHERHEDSGVVRL